MNGKVKFFDDTKHFGFIAADDGKDYFVHVSALDEGVRLKDNDPVEFEVEQGERGPKAVNVKVLSGDAAEASEEADDAPEESSEEAA